VEARSKTIEQWFSMIQQGQILLPRFQRHEAWRPVQIVGLLENVLCKPSLPIGALLILEVGDKELFHSRPIVGAPGPMGKPQMHLLDGQQRMTALWRSLTGDYGDLSLFVPLKGAVTETEAGEVVDDAPDVLAEKRWIHETKEGTVKVKKPLWADDDRQVFERGLLPIECLCPGHRGEVRLKEYKATLKAAGIDFEPYNDRIYDFRQRVAGYMIPFLALPVGTGKETALNVFIKMNTSASPLTDFDIVVAQLEEAMGQSLHDMVTKLKEKVPQLKRYGDIENNVLAVAALLNGKPALKKTYLEEDFGRQLGLVWERVCHGIQRGLAFLEREGVFGEKVLPTEVAVYLTCALWADVPEEGFDREGNARTIIRKALWRACFTNRYGKTATTRAYADYKALAMIIAGQKDAPPPELFDTKANPLPENDELVAAGWPSRKDRLPRAILAISLRQGGIDFADGAHATIENISKREYHHIFPVAWFDGNVLESAYNRVLNCALITWQTNRKLSDKSPTEYIKHRTEAATLGEAEIRRRLATHLVPFEPMKACDFDGFIKARAGLVEKAIQALCDGDEPRVEIN